MFDFKVVQGSNTVAVHTEKYEEGELLYSFRFACGRVYEFCEFQTYEEIEALKQCTDFFLGNRGE